MIFKQIFSLLKLSVAKFLYKKTEHFLNIIIIAIACVSIFITLISVSAVEKLSRQLTYSGDIRDTLLANYFDTYNKSNLTQNPPAPANFQDYKKHILQDLGAIDILITYNLSNLSFYLSDKPTNQAGSYLELAPKSFVQNELNKGFNWDKNNDETIPAILPFDLFYSFESSNPPKNPFEKYNLLSQIQNKYLGQKFHLYIAPALIDKHIPNTNNQTVNPTNTGILVQAVGFGDRIVLPDWSRKIASVDNLLQDKQSATMTIYNYQFKNATEANNILNNLNIRAKYNIQGSGGISNQAQIEQQLGVLQTFGYGAGIFFGILAIFLTISAITRTILESEQEIAIFQAMGFRILQINTIYIFFSQILLLLGYFIGLFFAYLILTIFSLVKGMDFLNFALDFANRFDSTLPQLVFVDFPIIKLTQFLFILMLISTIITFVAMSKANKSKIMDLIKR